MNSQCYCIIIRFIMYIYCMFRSSWIIIRQYNSLTDNKVHEKFPDGYLLRICCVDGCARMLQYLSAVPRHKEQAFFTCINC
jgi:hypothetical protein